MVMSDERWRDVIDYEGLYQVSDRGRIRSLRYSKLMKPGSERGGHQYVILCRGRSSRKTAKIHRLVLEAFVGPCPCGMECVHEDGRPFNNKLDNLSWKTPKENQADRVRHGTDIRGEDHVNAKLTECAVIEIRKLAHEGVTRRDLADRFGVDSALITRVVQGKVWSHVEVSPW